MKTNILFEIEKHDSRPRGLERARNLTRLGLRLPLLVLRLCGFSS